MVQKPKLAQCLAECQEKLYISNSTIVTFVLMFVVGILVGIMVSIIVISDSSRVFDDDRIKLDNNSPKEEKYSTRMNPYVSFPDYLEEDESPGSFRRRVNSSINKAGHSRIKCVLQSFKVCKVNDDAIKLDINSQKMGKCRTRRKRYASYSSYFEHDESPESLRGRQHSAINEDGYSRNKCVIPPKKRCNENDDGITLDINSSKSRTGRRRYFSCSSYFDQEEPQESFRMRLHS